MSASKQFRRPVEFLSTTNIVGTTGGSVYIAGGLNVNSFNTNSSTIANLVITNNLLTSSGNNLVSSQWTSISQNIAFTTGNVGINTTTPGFTLDVNGGARIIGGLTTGTLTTVIGASIPSLLSSTILASTSVSSGALYSTNITSSNIVGTTATIPNITFTNITTSTLLAINGVDLPSVGSGSGVVFNTNSQIYSNTAAGSSDLQMASFGGKGIRIITGGFVGISGSTITASFTPFFPLDINGTTRITNTTATSMGTLIVSGPGATTYLPATTTSGQLASFYGPGGANVISNIDLSTFIPASGSNNLPTVRFSMLDLGAFDSSFNILTKNAGGSGTMASRIMIAGSGNVGINTTNPAFTLDVSGTTRITNGSLIVASSAALGGIATILTDNFVYQSQTTVGNYGLKWATDADFGGGPMAYLSGYGGIKFFTTSTPRMTIQNGGNVGINTTAPGDYLQVASVMLMASTGNLTVTGDVLAFGTISDKRLKENVNNINNGLETINNLRPVTFNWKQDIFNEKRRGTSDSGFIAQEVENIIPHAVGEYNLIESKEIYKNMRHERIIPYLVNAIQDLKKQVDELQEFKDSFA